MMNTCWSPEPGSESCMVMAARQRQCSPWSDLQPELLGLVLRRLPSLADRVRLGAVCRPWRLHARQERLPSPLPWLTLLDGTFLSIPDGEIHRVPLPEGTRRCHGSMGNWLFLEHIGGGCSLTSPFSKAVVQLPDLRTIWCRGKMNALAQPRHPVYMKLVPLSSSLMDPTPDSLFAVMTMDKQHRHTISVCRPRSGSAFRVPKPRHFLDVAFFGGKLYALSQVKLFAVEIDPSYNGTPEIPRMRCIVDSIDDPGTTLQSFVDKGYDCLYWPCLAESGGRLLHVRRLIGVLFTVPEKDRTEHARTLSFELFEADFASTCRGQWKRVHTLGGQALFVGTHSKSLPASECGAQEDCIYFMRDYDRTYLNEDCFCDSGVFNMKNGEITPLLPETAVVRPQGAQAAGRPAWFFPTEAM